MLTYVVNKYSTLLVQRCLSLRKGMGTRMDPTTIRSEQCFVYMGAALTTRQPREHCFLVSQLKQSQTSHALSSIRFTVNMEATFSVIFNNKEYLKGYLKLLVTYR